MPEKKLTYKDLYMQLKKHTEDAGMKVTVKNGKVVVTGGKNGRKR